MTDEETEVVPASEVQEGDYIWSRQGKHSGVVADVQARNQLRSREDLETDPDNAHLTVYTFTLEDGDLITSSDDEPGVKRRRRKE